MKKLELLRHLECSTKAERYKCILLSLMLWRHLENRNGEEEDFPKGLRLLKNFGCNSNTEAAAAHCPIRHPKD
jgi:hypothetical protein